MYCKNCGKEIDNNAIVCPHCCAQVNRTAITPAREESNTIAIVGFIFSFLFALVGLICSIIGYKKAPERGGKHRGLALAGIIISSVSMGLALLINFL